MARATAILIGNPSKSTYNSQDQPSKYANLLILKEKMSLNRSYLSICLLVLISGFSSLLLGYGALYLYLSPNLPSVETLRELKFETPLRVYSEDQKLIGEIGVTRSIPISFEEAPPLLIKAFLAAEDDGFYAHNGVSIMAILRATSQMLLPGQTQTGGSTITMQVAKNSFPIDDGSVIYKANQIFLALKIEKELEKDEILELYINQNYLGNRAVGIEAAAQVYYGKATSDLSIAQYAMIAGLPKAPSSYNPIVNPDRALVRRDWILSRMLKLDYINQEQYDQEIAAPVTASLHGQSLDISAPYVTEMVRSYMLDHYGEEATTLGYKVFTTVNSRLQDSAQTAVVNGLLDYDQRHGFRGPEKQLTPQFVSAEDALENEEQEDSPRKLYKLATIQEETLELIDVNNAAIQEGDSDKYLDLDPWLAELAPIESFAGLHAAAVLTASEQTLITVLADGQIITIPWENGLNETRRYVNENYAPKISSINDILKLGDVVRVREITPGQWHFSQLPNVQSALVSMDPSNGAVRALVGGFNFYHNKFNRAYSIRGQRQPGSNFKPFLYTAALENGFTPATIINDAPISIYDPTLETTWRPQNSDGKFEGPMRLREALYRSRNIVAIKMLQTLGTSKAIKDIDRFGFEKSHFPRNDLSIALGTRGLTPWQVARGYTVFANGGYKVEPYFIQRIELLDGTVVFEEKPITVCDDCKKPLSEEELEALMLMQVKPRDIADRKNDQDIVPSQNSLEQSLQAELDALTDSNKPSNFNTESENENPLSEAHESARTGLKHEKIIPEPLPQAPRVVDERTAFIIDSMLHDVIASSRGTGWRARELGRSDLAGKTGTTNDNTDAWFSGYNEGLVTTTWVGFDQPSPLGRSEVGGYAALPIWMEYMKVALDGVPEKTLRQPEGITRVRINSKTGLRTQASDPNAIFEYFKTEEVPEWDNSTEQLIDSSGSEETHPDQLF